MQGLCQRAIHAAVALFVASRYKSPPTFFLPSLDSRESDMALRRHLIHAMLVGLCAVMAADVCLAPTFAQSSGGAAVNAGRQVSLKDQLTFGLMVRTKAEREFIDLVVRRVDEGVLPRPLVDSTFLWARQRAAQRRDSGAIRPMIYFRPGLIARAKLMKIDF
jgi:hypothetical protein